VTSSIEAIIACTNRLIEQGVLAQIKCCCCCINYNKTLLKGYLLVSFFIIGLKIEGESLPVSFPSDSVGLVTPQKFQFEDPYS
jgi:hypothetical protein